jgi:hypothetical protein
MQANELATALTSSEETLETSLGIAVVYDRDRSGRKFSMDYRARGATAYAKFRAALAPHLCDPKTKELRPWIAAVADGDVRDVAVATLALCASNLGLSAAIAIPLAALVAKRGLKDICAELPKVKAREVRTRRKLPVPKATAGKRTKKK